MLKSVAVAWFEPDQYSAMLAVAADRHRLHNTHDAYAVALDKKLAELRASGVNAVKMPIRTDDLVQWCQANGRQVDPESRATFAAVLAMRRDTQ